ncbi:hypothetical protein [uncultured Dokdonia sp.]|uniref:hypothetical protein n=1 Tax=uncultured Dokdonia sp. TaxID=575653 RepID=UPI00262E8B01|nr:hypothetical protein [uncultured Dokdonia sp.]
MHLTSMYKKITSLLFIFYFLIIGCDPIENNSRIVFNLKVTDEENQPLPDIDINASLRDTSIGVSFFIFPSFEGFEGVIGVGSTDTQGEISLISLDPDLFQNEIAVVINGDEQFGMSSVNQEYGIVTYLLDSIANKATLLPDTVLKRSATLEIEIIDVLDMEGSLAYTITYSPRIQQFRFPSGEELTSDTVEGFGEPLSSEELTFETLQNTIALFSYTITLDSGVVETNTIEIPINQDIVQYAFEF